jgi:hypothetical protein
MLWGKSFFGYGFRDDGKSLARMRERGSASGAIGWPDYVLASLFVGMRESCRVPRRVVVEFRLHGDLNRPHSPPLSDLPVGLVETTGELP